MSAEFALLRDGRQVLIRPSQPHDRPVVEAFFARLSPESRALRFHSGGWLPSTAALDLVLSGYTLVAELGGRLVALASYYRLRDPQRAEMAIAVDDAEQGRGIGTVLFDALARAARRAGIQYFVAEVLASNHRMLGLLQGLDFQSRRAFAHGVVEVDVALCPDPAYVAHPDARRQVAAVASLEPIFRPRSCARSDGPRCWRRSTLLVSRAFWSTRRPLPPLLQPRCRLRPHLEY